MKAGERRAIQIVLIAVLVGCAAAFATRRDFYVEALVDPFFGLALASVLILHFRLRPRWLDAVFVGASTLILAFADFYLLHYPARLVAWLSFFGISSLLVLGVDCVIARKEDRKLLIFGWVPALLFLASDWFASNMLQWVAEAHPKTLDLYLLSFDASLHVQLSFAMGQLFATGKWLRNAGLFFYMGLAIPITMVYAGRLARFGAKAFSAMLAFLITGPVGIVFYNIFPASGPRNTAHQFFPFHPLSISQTARLLLEPVHTPGPRNAMPSLHMAWVLLAWWYSLGLSRVERGITLAFVAFTILATLGTGEHYFIDLVVAFPFVLMIQAICAYELPLKDSRRLQAFALGLGGVLAWFAALRFANRFFWASPVIPWVLAAATVALVTLRQRDFQSAVAQKKTQPESEAVSMPVHAN